MFDKDLDCIIEECKNKRWAKKLCGTHYRRFKRHGDPNFINPKCNRDGNYIKRARKKTAQWKRDNPRLNSAFSTARKTKIKQAMLSSIDPKELIKIYEVCPKGYQVDHIIPINHKDVCGLHTPWNLQYLTKQDNANKSNKFDGTYTNITWKTK